MPLDGTPRVALDTNDSVQIGGMDAPVRKLPSAFDTMPERGRKRRSINSESSSKKRSKKSKDEQPEETNTPEKPRLTTPDLQFDYDRSQLRDPRETPGRVQRPMLRGELEVTEEFKSNFFIPRVEKPKGRLNAGQKDQIFREQAFLDPSERFHDLYVCYRKGRDGSPTYDEGGFQLDFEKVSHWMKPKSYNKSSIVRSMDRRLAEGRQEDDEIFGIFFADPENVDYDQRLQSKFHVKDRISKDLGIPFHQIGSQHAREWQHKGFEKRKFSEWWQPHTKEEWKRQMKMETGSRLRKDL
ncbi:hypothetical protein F5Y18DRAFT_391205 [Xylariaceae sp. FL1019]|nr:hypothetical protein F5Y18DRAFT_391205 [Xylariaceae sp. FL1019]